MARGRGLGPARDRLLISVTSYKAMSELETPPQRATPEPLPANLTSGQPGGGYCYGLELAWGHLRRWYLRTFRAGLR